MWIRHISLNFCYLADKKDDVIVIILTYCKIQPHCSPSYWTHSITQTRLPVFHLVFLKHMAICNVNTFKANISAHQVHIGMGTLYGIDILIQLHLQFMDWTFNHAFHVCLTYADWPFGNLVRPWPVRKLKALVDKTLIGRENYREGAQNKKRHCWLTLQSMQI